jgi:hypothetical protein
VEVSKLVKWINSMAELWYAHCQEKMSSVCNLASPLASWYVKFKATVVNACPENE